ncbi:MAG: 30S ribosomal protein S6 [bacterium]|nr:30S ribosomal protein S6 [bacterium]
MRDYELALILFPEEQKEREKVISKVKKDLEGLGGTIKKEDEWGKKTLAYPIKHQNEGVYFLWEISLGSEKTNELEKKFRLEEKILRHLLVKAEIRKPVKKGAKKIEENNSEEVKKVKRSGIKKFK